MRPYFIVVFTFFICCQKETQLLEECYFTSPHLNDLIINDVPVVLSLAMPAASEFTTFYLDGDSIGTMSGEDAFSWTPQNCAGGDHVISARINLINGTVKACSVLVFVPYSFFEKAQGGTIFSLDETGRHGLVVAHHDLIYSEDNQFVWGPETFLNATDTADGSANTLILANTPIMGSYFWSLFKIGYIHSGYSDWYVPSKTEFLLLAERMDELENTDPAFLQDMYWTSTECCRALACAVDFNTGTAISCLKADSLFRIRPVRKF